MNWSSCFTWYADNILIILEAYRTIEFIFLDIAKVFRQFLKFFGRASSILAHSWCVCWGRSWSQNERLAILLFPPLLCQSDILLLSVDIVWSSKVLMLNTPPTSGAKLAKLSDHWNAKSLPDLPKLYINNKQHGNTNPTQPYGVGHDLSRLDDLFGSILIPVNSGWWWLEQADSSKQWFAICWLLQVIGQTQDIFVIVRCC